MKIVVIGGSGPIGSELVKRLRDDGHDPLAAFPGSGSDTLVGKGLAEAPKGAQLVLVLAGMNVDVRDVTTLRI